MKKVKLSNSTEINIYDDEVQGVLTGISQKDNIVAVRNGVFNSSYFVAIVDSDNEEKKNQTQGILHDGALVIRYFGSWYLDGEFDEHGRPTRRIDPAYYPEVARDVVPTRKEFEQKYRALPRLERLKLMVAGTKEPRIGGLKRIGEAITTNIKRLTNPLDKKNAIN